MGDIYGHKAEGLSLRNDSIFANYGSAWGEIRRSSLQIDDLYHSRREYGRSVAQRDEETETEKWPPTRPIDPHRGYRQFKYSIHPDTESYSPA